MSDSRKSALVVSWSQTGQLDGVTRAFTDGLADAGWRIETARPKLARAYPFPWSLREFFGVFPEIVYGRIEPAELERDGSRYDLVVVGYQVWFLSPGPAFQGVFDSGEPDFVRGVPVVSVVGCRNMWYSAADRVREALDAAGARFLGAVVAIDESPQWATFVTTPRWLLTGKSDRFLRIFPPAGIHDGRLAEIRQLGRQAAAGWPYEVPEILEAALERSVDPKIAFADYAGGVIFRWWARILVRTREGSAARFAGLAGFAGWLLAAIPTLVPLAVIVRALMRGRIDDATLRRARRSSVAAPGVGG